MVKGLDNWVPLEGVDGNSAQLHNIDSESCQIITTKGNRATDWWRGAKVPGRSEFWIAAEASPLEPHCPQCPLEEPAGGIPRQSHGSSAVHSVFRTDRTIWTCMLMSALQLLFLVLTDFLSVWISSCLLLPVFYGLYSLGFSALSSEFVVCISCFVLESFRCVSCLTSHFLFVLWLPGPDWFHLCLINLPFLQYIRPCVCPSPCLFVMLPVSSYLTPLSSFLGRYLTFEFLTFFLTFAGILFGLNGQTMWFWPSPASTTSALRFCLKYCYKYCWTEPASSAATASGRYLCS